jgi:small subunit ribosomal protein S13
MNCEFFNIKINDTKEFKAAFSIIFGFNVFKLKHLYKILGLNKNKFYTIKTLNSFQIDNIKSFLPKLTIFDSNLKKKISIEYDKFFELKCYKRNRFLLKLPVNGQRTKSNAKTVRKLKC